MNNANILLVDDDGGIRELVGMLLQGDGYSVTPAPGGQEALALMSPEIDLVILDVMMPGLSGYTVCDQIRQQYNVPVLFLTAKGLDADLATGYASGGDDYLVKPFSNVELLARVKGLLRRYQVYKGKDAATDSEYMICQSLRVHPSLNEVYKGDEKINLTEIEYKILRLMLQHRRKTFSAESLYESVWEEPYLSISANTVMVHIRKLRTKLEDDPHQPQIIKTIWGKGYRID